MNSHFCVWIVLYGHKGLWKRLKKSRPKTVNARISGQKKDPICGRVRHSLTGGGRNGGYATFVWQERAQTRATQMTHMPSLKPLCLLCYNQGSLRHQRVICFSQRKNIPPIKVPPPFKSAWKFQGKTKHINIPLGPKLLQYLEGSKIEKIRDFERDWRFRARMKFSSEPPTEALFLWGNRDVEIEIFERDLKFRSRLKISSEIELFWSWGPLGTYHSIQNAYRQTFVLRVINSNCRYRIVLQEQLISITETDLWKFQQKSLITDTGSPLNSN